MSGHSKLGAALAHTINSASTREWTSFELSAVLKAILAEFVVIPRSELPEVVESGRNFRVRHVHYVSASSSEERRSEALALLALAEHVEARAETKRNARRDELAALIAGKAEGDPESQVNYSGMVRTAQIAIDRIIELEEQVTP